ncbi:reticulon-1-A isoform X4 [Nilaparvata lugens]|uniref:reticulon-1-A isoform X4 n=1 Tax=Nilaparvata lugens TaxID=108931 RepID=UPI00193CE02B|nr:reticulon-1-A isoform X4 [Nilaparvata lugens]
MECPVGKPAFGDEFPTKSEEVSSTTVNGEPLSFSLLCPAVVFDPWSMKSPTNRMWRRDSWFKPETLHPQVEALVYWRDPKKSGVVFGTILVALLSLTYYSFISVVAYFSLIILVGTISFKIYKSILQAVQKTSDGHPFKEILEMELTLPQEKVREVTDVGVAHLNAAILELRRLFLVEDLVDSIKFAVLLWLLTRVGAWFNGMTLIIIAFIALFSVPKIYENNKAQVDANLAIVQSKLQEITTKVKAALPIGKKEAEKDKEQ